jgi:hypothetical protein
MTRAHLPGMREPVVRVGRLDNAAAAAMHHTIRSL